MYMTRTDGKIDYDKCRKLVTDICVGIREHADIAIVGLSGGADSTLVASLCTLALQAVNVYGASMPYGETDTLTFNARSQELAKKLGINHNVFPIRQATGAITVNFPPISTLNAGNLRSRLRMVHLYTHCCNVAEANPQHRVRVMGTGNLSEDWIAYDTKFGDSAADLFPIGDLYKQEVYDLLDTLVCRAVLVDALIDRVPSAGLWEGQTDESELGYSYNAMAPAIEWARNHHLADLEPNQAKILLEGLQKAAPEVHKVVIFVLTRHLQGRHKHLAAPVLSLRA